MAEFVPKKFTPPAKKSNKVPLGKRQIGAPPPPTIKRNQAPSPPKDNLMNDS